MPLLFRAYILTQEDIFDLPMGLKLYLYLSYFLEFFKRLMNVLFTKTFFRYFCALVVEQYL